MNWYLEVLKKYTVFDGRSGRSEFWYFVLFSIVISIVLMVVDRAAGTVSSTGYGLIGSIYSLAVLLPAIGVEIRRMHDISRSGWWILFPIYNIVLWARESDTGENQYGPNPNRAT